MERTPVDRDALEAFVAVARAGTVRAAAETLGRTQPSISARLAALEDAWGVRLFRRLPRGMRSTPEGERLLPFAARALAAFDEVDRAAGAPVAEADAVRVGSGDALGRVLLPAALRGLQRERPATSFRIVEGPAGGLLEALRDGRIDLALVARPADPARDDAPDLEVESLVVSPAVVLVSRAEARPPRSFRLAALGARRLVALHPGSSFRAGLERAFARAGVAFRPAVEVGSLSLVRRYVAAGLGVAAVPEVAFRGREASAGVRLVPLVGAPPTEYRIVRRAAAPLPEPALRLVERLREAAAPETRTARRGYSPRTGAAEDPEEGG